MIRFAIKHPNVLFIVSDLSCYNPNDFQFPDAQQHDNFENLNQASSFLLLKKYEKNSSYTIDLFRLCESVMRRNLSDFNFSFISVKLFLNFFSFANINAYLQHSKQKYEILVWCFPEYHGSIPADMKKIIECVAAPFWREKMHLAAITCGGLSPFFSFLNFSQIIHRLQSYVFPKLIFFNRCDSQNRSVRNCEKSEISIEKKINSFCDSIFISDNCNGTSL